MFGSSYRQKHLEGLLQSYPELVTLRLAIETEQKSRKLCKYSITFKAMKYSIKVFSNLIQKLISRQKNCQKFEVEFAVCCLVVWALVFILKELLRREVLHSVSYYCSLLD